jgi:hypothetical protein
MKRERTMLSIDFPKELLENIRSEAKEKALSVGGYIKMLLATHQERKGVKK